MIVGPGLHLARPGISVIFPLARLELYTVAVLLTPGYWRMTSKPLLRRQTTITRTT